MEVGKITYKDLEVENFKVSNLVVGLWSILLFTGVMLWHTGKTKEAVAN